MAPLPVIANVMRVAFTWSDTVGGRTAENVMHFRAGTVTAAELATYLDGIVSAGMWNQTVTTVGVTQLDITPLDGTSATYTFATGRPAKWSGAISAGDIIPAGAAIVKLQTAKRGRSYRGRVYLPFVAEGANDSGTLHSTDVDALQSAWSAFLTTTESGDVAWVVASYVHATAEDIIAVTAEAELGTQRRRQRR